MISNTWEERAQKLLRSVEDPALELKASDPKTLYIIQELCELLGEVPRGEAHAEELISKILGKLSGVFPGLDGLQARLQTESPSDQAMMSSD
ncbi:MAG: hypothetical protein PHR28_07070 [candidate division Zixibacteria bacterium]|nr:hypothetical protein [candidate division Zixibacteria bacterium]